MNVLQVLWKTICWQDFFPILYRTIYWDTLIVCLCKRTTHFLAGHWPWTCIAVMSGLSEVQRSRRGADVPQSCDLSVRQTKHWEMMSDRMDCIDYKGSPAGCLLLCSLLRPYMFCTTQHHTCPQRYRKTTECEVKFSLWGRMSFTSFCFLTCLGEATASSPKCSLITFVPG